MTTVEIGDQATETTAANARLGLPPVIEACLFDLDGVLTRTAHVHAAAWKQAFDDYLSSRPERFAPFDEVSDYTRHVDGKPREDGVRSFLAALGITPSDADVRAIADHKTQLFEQLVRDHGVTTYAGSLRYLHAVRAAQLKTAVVSSSKHARGILRSAEIAELFDTVIDGQIAEARHLGGKPAPDTYLAAAEALAVDAAHAVVFEDALAGVAAGHAGHFGYVVGVDRADQAAQLRRHGADIVVSDLASLLETG